MTNFLKIKLVSMVALIAIIAGSVPFSHGYVDEGMFTPDKIKDLQLQKRGLKINPNEIYNPANGGISEAIIRLDSGCTGEFISSKGLILTNHHCGYDALVSASTKERNYAEIGFKTSSMAQEIPAKDYTISIPIRVEDVTARILAGSESLSGEAKMNFIKKRIDELTIAEQAKSNGNRISIRPVSDGYFYYLYEDKPINDIRLVYAPPANIGIYGGDPDNFEWTRQTGDFSFLRAYVAPDGSSATYSKDNVPYKPRKFLTINLNGINEDDFVFVMGNPGGTTRYRESQFINYSQTTNFPFLYQYLTAWINGLEKEGQIDEDKRIALQSDVASLRNSQKLYNGSTFALRRADATGLRLKEEAKFQAWANANPERKARYGNLLNDIAKTWNTSNPTPARDRLLRTIPNNNNSATYKQIIDAFSAVKNGTPLSETRKAEIAAAYENRSPLVEGEILKMFFSGMQSLPSGQRFAAADKVLAQKGSSDKLIAQILASGDFDTKEEIYAIYGMSLASINAKWGDLAELALAQGAELPGIFSRLKAFQVSIDPLRVNYMRGLAEMRGITPYPDANFTQRFTFGNVKGYLPREAVLYTPFTSIKGLLEKDTGVAPFNAPEKLRKLQETKDFGRYGKGDSVPVNFLSTTDIIGGNSGSPVLNAYGEQVGLVFDGNYEGLGNDIFFNPAYGRTISVDMRYVFFIVDKFDNVGWIMDEIKFAPARKEPRK